MGRTRSCEASKRPAANRRNAIRSTGPRTARGKAASSRNALRHGLRAGSSVILPGEDPEEFEELREGLLADLAPEGEVEKIVADRFVHLAWRIRRPAKAEAAILSREVWNAEEKLASEEMDRHVRYDNGNGVLLDALLAGYPGLDALKGKPVVVDEDAYRLAMEKWNMVRDKVLEADKVAAVFRGDAAGSLDLLQRYEVSLERSLFRCLGELRRLQAARKGS